MGLQTTKFKTSIYWMKKTYQQMNKPVSNKIPNITRYLRKQIRMKQKNLKMNKID